VPPQDMASALYYTLSTIAQTLAAALALLAAFVLFLFQSYHGPMRERMMELFNQSGMFSKEADRARLEDYRKAEHFAAFAQMFGDARWNAKELERIKSPLFILKLYLAVRNRATHRFKWAAICCSILIVLSVAAIPLTPWLSPRAGLAGTTLVVGVLGFAFCIFLCYRVVELALEKPFRPAITADASATTAGEGASGS
jgi:hypothetical protein